MSSNNIRRREFTKQLSRISNFCICGHFWIKGLGAMDKTENKVDNLRVQIVYNNLSNSEKLESEWGFAAWIKADGKNILFDTGGDGKILLKNLISLGLNPTDLEAIVISHRHWDHANGLTDILGYTGKDIKIYIPAGIKNYLKEKISNGNFIELRKATQIFPGIWSSGTLEFVYQDTRIAEHSLFINTSKGVTVITGCSHPGVDKIANKVNNILPESKISLITGGFHMVRHSEKDIKNISDLMKKMDVQIIAPSHCTGDFAIDLFRKTWGSKFKEMYLGDDIQSSN